MTLGPLSDAVATATEEAFALVDRVARRDHTVWEPSPQEIEDRLGWLDAAERGRDTEPRTGQLADELVDDGFTDVLLVGMGGSSLYPEVLARTFGPAPGFPRLRVLDSTDPAAVLRVEHELPWQSTLLVPASKSGTTLEMVCHLERFLERLHRARGDDAGRAVVPITDPGSELDARASADGFRTVVHGQPDVGGRFSALTPFGLFPAALLGMDVLGHLAPAQIQLEAATSPDPAINAPFVLGAIMAAAARHGRNKLTLLLPDEIRSFGAWIEQLVAESTGKHGVGILPVAGESIESASFGPDRLVVSIGSHPSLAGLVAKGVPVVELPWRGRDQLASEVVRFEVATAVAGALLGINPFDQPDVAAAKAAANEILSRGGDLPPIEDPAPVLASVVPGDYIALLGFVDPDGADVRLLERAAQRLRERFEVPVTVGVGPRYLHSTGQLHKGGPDQGAFLLVVGDDPEDAVIPGRDLSFSRLKRAQASGDLAALRSAGRRIAHVDIDAVRDL